MVAFVVVVVLLVVMLVEDSLVDDVAVCVETPLIGLIERDITNRPHTKRMAARLDQCGVRSLAGFLMNLNNFGICLFNNYEL